MTRPALPDSLAPGPAGSNGGLYASIPFRQAFDEACTHVLALLTRPAGQTLGRTGLMNSYVLSRRLAKYNPLLGSAFENRGTQYVGDLDWLNTHTCAPIGSPYVRAISPPRGTPGVRRFEKQCELLSGAISGMNAILRFRSKQFICGRRHRGIKRVPPTSALHRTSPSS